MSDIPTVNVIHSHRTDLNNPMNSFQNWVEDDAATLDVVDWLMGGYEEDPHLGGVPLKNRLIQEAQGGERYTDAQVSARAALVNAFNIKMTEDRVSESSQRQLEQFEAKVAEGSVLGRFKAFARTYIAIDPEMPELPAAYWNQLLEFSTHHRGAIVHNMLSVYDGTDLRSQVDAVVQSYATGI